MDKIIRKAIAADCPSIARLQVDSYRSAYAALLPPEYLAHFDYRDQAADWRALLADRPEAAVFVALDGEGRIAGYALGEPNEADLPPFDSELVALHVAPGYHGRGFGRSLLAAVARQLVLRGCRSLFAWVLAENPARRFYEKLGGMLIGRKPWANNAYFGVRIEEVAYGWPEIARLIPVKGD